MTPRPGGSDRGPFWSVFDRSNIPMALIDRDYRYVAVNDALVDFYGAGREEIVGTPASSGNPDTDPAAAEATWEELFRTGELYGEHVIRLFSAPPMRVSYAAHATALDEEQYALFVMLSAQLEPDGDELVGSVTEEPAPSGPSDLSSVAKRLTRREREIVQRVALGRSTPQIATDLNVSPATVRSHVRNAMVKTGAHTRAQLVALVLGEGLAGE